MLITGGSYYVGFTWRGGSGNQYLGDVWRSVDNGTTWTELSSWGIGGRSGHSGIALQVSTAVVLHCVVERSHEHCHCRMTRSSFLVAEVVIVVRQHVGTYCAQQMEVGTGIGWQVLGMADTVSLYRYCRFVSAVHSSLSFSYRAFAGWIACDDWRIWEQRRFQ